MRLKTALTILLTTGAVAVLIVWTRPQPAPPAGEQISPATSVQVAAASVPIAQDALTKAAESSTPSPATPAPAKPETAEDHRARVEAEREQLLEWSMNHDNTSFSNILVRLTSKDQEIRAAAIEAARQFGSSNAIPALTAAADATDDLREKIECLDAAEFLTLPALPFASPPAGLQEEMEARAIARQKELNPIGETTPNPPVEMPASNQQP